MQKGPLGIYPVVGVGGFPSEPFIPCNALLDKRMPFSHVRTCVSTFMAEILLTCLTTGVFLLGKTRYSNLAFVLP